MFSLVSVSYGLGVLTDWALPVLVTWKVDREREVNLENRVPIRTTAQKAQGVKLWGKGKTEKTEVWKKKTGQQNRSAKRHQGTNCGDLSAW